VNLLRFKTGYGVSWASTAVTLSVGVEREVTGVVETHLGARDVALERFSTSGQEQRITLAPDRQQWWLLCEEIFLELGIQRDIAGVIQKQVKLDLVIAGPNSYTASLHPELPRSLPSPHQLDRTPTDSS
jgi:hypothetical protein